MGGYYIIRGKNSFGMTRCAKFKHRPGHADMLHFDLWYKGVNVLTDIGSYSYNPEDKFRDYFTATRNHNTITINDQNQTKKGPRFLTINWPDGFLKKFKNGEDSVFFSGFHTAYTNIHTRTIEYKDNCYVITDQIDNEEREIIKIKLNWNIGTEIVRLGESKFRLLVEEKDSLLLEISSNTPGNVQIYFGDEDRPAGWRSLYYGEIMPVNQLVYEVESKEAKEEIRTTIKCENHY